MQMILFSGQQATGKSSLFKSSFVDTHLCIKLDMLRTRYRQVLMISAYLVAKQPFLIDNTNLTSDERSGHITQAKAQRISVLAYRVNLPFEEALKRNTRRFVSVPERARRSAYKNWQMPD
jgi:predicted kinase